MLTDRNEHLTRCKNKALTELGEGRPDQISQALQTLITDLVNNQKTKYHYLIAIVALEASSGLITTKDELIKFFARFD